MIKESVSVLGLRATWLREGCLQIEGDPERKNNLTLVEELFAKDPLYPVSDLDELVLHLRLYDVIPELCMEFWFRIQALLILVSRIQPLLIGPAKFL
jgi:hypothetical protein